MKQSLVTAALMLLGVIAGVGAYFYHGRYNMAADEKHWALTERVLETVRIRSIQARARENPRRAEPGRPEGSFRSALAVRGDVRVAWVYNSLVRPSYRGRGVAAPLYQHADATCCERGRTRSLV